MDLKRIGKSLLFPHFAVLLILLPSATAFLVYSMICLGTESPVAIGSYVLAAYTLTVWCLRIPRIISLLKNFKNENKYAVRWLGDPRLRVNVSLYGASLWNTAYAVFQLWLGFYHHTFWYYSLAGYYFSLAVMRFFLALHSRKYKPGEKMLSELRKYRACGWCFLATNLALSLMIFFMVYWNRTFNHHEITTIAMAAYTFTSLTVAIINVIKYKKYKSPIYSASKAISLASACVSMLTLESTMLTTFGDESMDLLSRRILLGATGGAISAFIIAMAVYMIATGTKKIKIYKSKESPNGK